MAEACRQPGKCVDGSEGPCLDVYDLVCYPAEEGICPAGTTCCDASACSVPSHQPAAQTTKTPAVHKTTVTPVKLPVNCEFQWGAWSPCSKPCDGGQQSRSPNILRQAQHGGNACPSPQTQACNTAPCPCTGYCAAPAASSPPPTEYPAACYPSVCAPKSTTSQPVVRPKQQQSVKPMQYAYTEAMKYLYSRNPTHLCNNCPLGPSGSCQGHIQLVNPEEDGKVACFLHGPHGQWPTLAPAPVATQNPMVARTTVRCQGGHYSPEIKVSKGLQEDGFNALVNAFAYISQECESASAQGSKNVKVVTIDGSNSCLVTEDALNAADITLENENLAHNGVAMSLGHGVKEGACGSFAFLKRTTEKEDYVNLNMQIGMRAWSGEFTDGMGGAMSYISQGLQEDSDPSSGYFCVQPQVKDVPVQNVKRLFEYLCNDPDIKCPATILTGLANINATDTQTQESAWSPCYFYSGGAKGPFTFDDIGRWENSTKSPTLDENGADASCGASDPDDWRGCGILPTEPTKPTEPTEPTEINDGFGPSPGDPHGPRSPVCQARIAFAKTIGADGCAMVPKATSVPLCIQTEQNKAKAQAKGRPFLDINADINAEKKGDGLPCFADALCITGVRGGGHWPGPSSANGQTNSFGHYYKSCAVNPNNPQNAGKGGLFNGNLSPKAPAPRNDWATTPPTCCTGTPCPDTSPGLQTYEQLAIEACNLVADEMDQASAPAGLQDSLSSDAEYNTKTALDIARIWSYGTKGMTLPPNASGVMDGGLESCVGAVAVALGECQHASSPQSVDKGGCDNSESVQGTSGGLWQQSGPLTKENWTTAGTTTIGNVTYTCNQYAAQMKSTPDETGGVGGGGGSKCDPIRGGWCGDPTSMDLCKTCGGSCNLGYSCVGVP